MGAGKYFKNLNLKITSAFSADSVPSPLKPGVICKKLKLKALITKFISTIRLFFKALDIIDFIAFILLILMVLVAIPYAIIRNAIG